MENIKREVSSDLTNDDIEALKNTEFDENGKAIESNDEKQDEELEKPEEPVSSPEKEVEEVEEKKDEIKYVEGESAKERALRLEVTRVKREKRELMQQNILLSQQKPATNDWKKNLRDRGYTEEQIEEQEKLQNDMALAKGFISRDDLEKEKLNNTFEDFISNHDEYLPEKDKDDVRYGRFIQILKNDYNLNGKSQGQIKSIFEKVHRDVVEEFGEAKSDKGKIEAKNEKIKAVSASTASAKNVIPKSEKIEVKKVSDKNFIVGGLNFKGFDEDDF